MEDDLRWREERERRLSAKKELHADEADATVNDADEYQEKDDEDIYFAPERGNVVFASAIDGWGFRIGKFAQLYAAKLGMKEANLRRVLWGDFYLDPKTKKVISYKHLRGRALKPLFVQFVLENIWAVYDAVMLNPCVISTFFLPYIDIIASVILIKWPKLQLLSMLKYLRAILNQKILGIFCHLYSPSGFPCQPVSYRRLLISFLPPLSLRQHEYQNCSIQTCPRPQ